jgi:hypothetical protein
MACETMSVTMVDSPAEACTVRSSLLDVYVRFVGRGWSMLGEVAHNMLEG